MSELLVGSVVAIENSLVTLILTGERKALTKAVKTYH